MTASEGTDFGRARVNHPIPSEQTLDFAERWKVELPLGALIYQIGLVAIGATWRGNTRRF